jgi:hypothetical protein
MAGSARLAEQASARLVELLLLRNAPSAFRSIDRYVYERMRDFLAKRHKVAGRGTRRFSCDIVYGEYGLLRLERLPLHAPSAALR